MGRPRKHNTYDLSGEYGIGWTTNTNQEFYFDLEDYDKIKDYCWSERIQGNYHYLLAGISGSTKTITMHILLHGKHKDHINRNTLDNRKCNIRDATVEENARNHKINSNNTSGFAGVSWHKKNCVWISYITVNKKRQNLGSFSNKDDAVRARLVAEMKYFGPEFAPQRHLFEQYKINIEMEEYS